MRQSKYQNRTQMELPDREFKITCCVKQSNGKSNMQEEMGDVSRDKNSRRWSKGNAGNKKTLTKNACNGLISKLDTAEERIHALEGRQIETFPLKWKRKKE